MQRALAPLFELDKKIYKSGDEDSLLKLTLNFALMKTQTKKGSILLWDEESKKLKIFLTTDFYAEHLRMDQEISIDQEVDDKNLSEKIELEIDSKKIKKWFELKNIIIVSELKKHPIFSSLFSLYPKLSIWEKIIEKDETIFSIPVTRDKKSRNFWL